MTEATLGGNHVPLAVTFLVTLIVANLGMEYLGPMLATFRPPWWLDVAHLALVAALMVYAVRIVPPKLGRHR